LQAGRSAYVPLSLAGPVSGINWVLNNMCGTDASGKSCFSGSEKSGCGGRNVRRPCQPMAYFL
jgi:hypothetical protein